MGLFLNSFGMGGTIRGMKSGLLIAVFVVALSSIQNSEAATRPTRELELSRGRDQQLVLWDESLAYFDQEKDASARLSLERYLARFSHSPQRHEARLLLAVVLLRQGESRTALPHLKMLAEGAASEVKGQPGELYWRSRVLMAQAYLNLKKWHEAELVARELGASSRRFQAEGLLIQSEARLRRIQRSRQVSADWDLSLKSGEGFFLDPSPWLEKEQSAEWQSSVVSRVSPRFEELQQRRIWVSNQSHLEKCSHFLKGGPLDEAGVRAQLDARGSCLVEALGKLTPLYTDHLTQLGFRRPGIKWQMDFLSAASDDWREGFVQFAKRVQFPPGPPGKRTSEELKVYFFELKAVLDPLVQDWARRSLEVIESWKTHSPEKTALPFHSRLQNLQATLQASKAGLPLPGKPKS